MTKKAALLVALSVLLITITAFAQSPDTNGMTDEQLQAYIQGLQQQALQQPQPQLVVSSLDEETKGLLESLKVQVDQLTRSNEQLESRFAQMAVNTKTQIENSEKDTVEAVTSELDRQLMWATDDLKAFVLVATNPIRTAMPLIGLFGMLTGAFLLWAAKYFSAGGK